MKLTHSTRRRFLAASTSIAVAGCLPSVAAAADSAPAKRIPVGVQLWTLRKEMAEDPAGTLGRVAEIGYQGVELWFQKWPEAAELKKMVADSGLRIASAHVNLKDLLDDFPRVADYHRTIGNQTLVIPYIPNYAGLSQDDWRRTIDEIRHAARTGTEAGFQVLYHNHDFEFTTKVGDVEATILEIRVDKLSYTGPKRIVTWIYHLPDLDLAVQFLSLIHI